MIEKSGNNYLLVFNLGIESVALSSPGSMPKPAKGIARLDSRAVISNSGLEPNPTQPKFGVGQTMIMY